MINYNMELVVWLAETDKINIWVNYVTTEGNLLAYQKSGTNSITFGAHSTDTTHTITRNGNSFTITATDNSTITALYGTPQ